MAGPSTAMQVVETIEAVRRVRRAWGDDRVVLVPTMGALHEGHRSLMQMARALGQRVVASIYVNPLQFGANEDLSRYPRSLEADLESCRALGVDLVFTPSDAVMYPQGREGVTRVLPPEALTAQLCGLSRPGHFEGVATVVLKLFSIVQPDMAVFGEKDAQQLAVIRRMAADLNLPVEIIAHPTVREPDGLALSSRNRYFSTDEEREAARILSRTLRAVRDRASAAGKMLPVQPTLDEALADVLARPEFSRTEVRELFRLEYLRAVDGETFRPVEGLSAGTRVLMAARVGEVRLIDNLLLGPS